MRNRHTYQTVGNGISFPQAALRQAALAASQEALAAYWEAERLLGKPGAPAASLLHRQVIEADRTAKAWARVVGSAR